MEKIAVYFLNGNSKKVELHYNQKQYRDDVIVELQGNYYEVYFYVKDALEYEMTKDGFFSFPGMIILEEITTDNIYKSLNELMKYNYFSNFTSHKKNPVNDRFVNKWYVNFQIKNNLEDIYKYELFVNIDNV